jgi:hypothetical protein
MVDHRFYVYMLGERGLPFAMAAFFIPPRADLAVGTLGAQLFLLCAVGNSLAVCIRVPSSYMRVWVGDPGKENG